ncbi:MAG: outer membrane beta-barrel protein [Saprospiraceae bacterium]|nr:porin [Saprospiraceae bacterium]
MRKFYFLVAFLAVITPAFSQIQLDSSFTLSGSADVYFRKNLNSSNTRIIDGLSTGTTTAPGSSFANLPGFSLGMFNLIGTYSTEKYGFKADLVFGPRGADAVFLSAPALNIINQMYGWYQLSDKVKVTMGNFNTYLGYEVISPTVNYNYSTSYMFSYGPFSHTGLKIDFDLGSGLSLTGALMNPTDYTDFDPFGKFYYGGQLGYAGDKGSAFLNYLGGDGYSQIDLTAGTQLTDKFFVGLNATTAKDLFYGAAIYAQVAATDALGFGVRAEYFADQGIGIVGGVDESVTDVTFSLNYTVGNFRLIPEVRVDLYSSEDFVVTDSRLTGGEYVPSEFSKNLASFVLAAVYSF